MFRHPLRVIDPEDAIHALVAIVLVVLGMAALGVFTWMYS